MSIPIYYPCGDIIGRDHRAGCVLGQAETIVTEAAERGLSVVDALAALVELGMLRPYDPRTHDHADALLGIVDQLFAAQLLQPAGGAS